MTVWYVVSIPFWMLACVAMYGAFRHLMKVFAVTAINGCGERVKPTNDDRAASLGRVVVCLISAGIWSYVAARIIS